MSDTPKFSCIACQRTDLTLTANGRVRSHAANGKRPDPTTNPHCPGGSELPRETRREAARQGEPRARALLEQAGEELPPIDGPAPQPNPYRKPLDPSHRHVYVWADDGNGHSGSVCSCGKEEPEGLPHDRYTPQPVTHDPATAARNGHKVETLAAGDRNHPSSVTATIDEEPRVPQQLPPPGAQADEADDFLGGGGEAEAGSGGNGPGPWFDSRYDGDCSNCFRAFYAGDRIRADGEGGYEAEDCCGQDEDDIPPEVARKVAAAPVHRAPTLPVRNGRYSGPDPVTGKASRWTRTTTWASTLSDSFSLNQWMGRMAIMGLVVRPDLFEKTKSCVQGYSPAKPHEIARLERDLLNTIVEDAKLAAGSKERAAKGTTLHKHTEEIESGRRALADVPEEYRRTVAAYLACLEKYGLVPVKGLIERSTLSQELGVVGTFDRILQATKDIDLVLKVDKKRTRKVRLHAGQFVIGDVKSGESLEFPWLEILIQLSIYAHGANESGIATPDDNDDGEVYWRWANLKEFGVDQVREDLGIVMHIPYGEDVCHLYPADLTTGWRGAKLCGTVREWQKLDVLGEPFGSMFAPDAVSAPLTAEQTAPAVPAQPPAPAAETASQMPPVYHAPAGDHDDSEMLPASEAPGSALVEELKRELGETDWDVKFQSVSTREESIAAWQAAKAAGVAKEKIEELVNMAKLGQDYEARCSLVTTKAEASALWAEMRSRVQQIGMTRMTKCVKIMQDRLK